MTRQTLPPLPGAPRPYGPVPGDRQLAWHSRPLYGFVHFTVNTFTDREWGYGDEAPGVFDPTRFDADQIVESAASGGLSGLILTCKHHDGFCLWPSRYTEHSVKNSSWRGGRGNVVKELSEACSRLGLRFGIYLSPWDRNHASYGSPAYVTYYRNQLRELLSDYGPLFEVWFDGANGGDGYYGGAREKRLIDKRTYYGWEETWRMIRDLQPDACIFSDAGPDVRWVGNEDGEAGETCWATLKGAEFLPGQSDKARQNAGDRDGTEWMPAECDVSIRPGWFHHASEDGKVKSPDRLMEIYFRSIGRGASLLLNLPPDRRGWIHEADVKSLTGFRRRVDALFACDLARTAQAVSGPARGGDVRFAPLNLMDGSPDTYWATDDGQPTAEAVLEFPSPVRFDVVGLREHLPLGQRVDSFSVDAEQEGDWKEIGRGTSIGSLRLLRVGQTSARRVRLRITGASACPAVGMLGLWRGGDLLPGTVPAV